MIVAQINRGPRDERHPEEHIHVCPQNRRIDPANELNEVMMIDPVYGDDDEAQGVSEKSWPQVDQGRGSGIMRRFQLQDHDSNDNRHYPVAERFKPVGFHLKKLDTAPSAFTTETTITSQRANFRRRDDESVTDFNGLIRYQNLVGVTSTKTKAKQTLNAQRRMKNSD